jgi:hypothetical protein
MKIQFIKWIGKVAIYFCGKCNHNFSVAHAKDVVCIYCGNERKCEI